MDFINFKLWLGECDRLLREREPNYSLRDADGNLDAVAWKESYYDVGLSPEEAVDEEMDHVQ